MNNQKNKHRMHPRHRLPHAVIVKDNKNVSKPIYQINEIHSMDGVKRIPFSPVPATTTQSNGDTIYEDLESKSSNGAGFEAGSETNQRVSAKETLMDSIIR